MTSPSKIAAVKFDRDNRGDVMYPIFVSPTLKIMNLGVIDYQRPFFHSNRNIFPIGY